ncbi:MAG: NADH:ubiquinone oxidoreductase [Cyphobasidiales sp. Tagirdzhanova-0007]|nr:MAG: NADH:ubiquinone oxidoreductase [Cyphobasidiales sp. Tagirdzhanova-0007]
MSSDDDPPTFDDPAKEARHYRLLAKDLQDELEDMKLALEEFQGSSKELEEEMEKEMAATEKREGELRTEAERLRSEVDGWKTRHQSALREHSTTLAHMHKELESLRGSEKTLRSKLRDMELDNDDLEKSERAISSTLGDVESRFNRAVERTALLEQELIDKARLEEELQRLKDELRDSVEEIGFLRSHRDEALATAAEAMTRGRQRQSTSLGIQEAATTLTGIEGSRRASISTAGVPSPDIDSADETSQQEPSSIDHELCKPKSILLPSSSSTNRTAIVRASPSKLPVSATSTPDISPSVPLEKGKERLPSPIHNPLIARSSNARNLSYLARKSVTPKAIRDKRTDGIGEYGSIICYTKSETIHTSYDTTAPCVIVLVKHLVISRYGKERLFQTEYGKFAIDQHPKQGPAT